MDSVTSTFVVLNVYDSWNRMLGTAISCDRFSNGDRQEARKLEPPDWTVMISVPRKDSDKYLHFGDGDSRHFTE